MGKRSVNVAIVGCGLIGQKRAKALAGGGAVICADSNLVKAEQLASPLPKGA